ncbi:hypothetical protein [Bifidobacterium jacchi]|uniref:hypothetical protein n=1 Tax=Bifidobacterium jacchi TaxID=2490545 RepID=UPI0015880CC5|nr:hypothetical protein [Bifidobacterium jacchi]
MTKEPGEVRGLSPHPDEGRRHVQPVAHGGQAPITGNALIYQIMIYQIMIYQIVI